MSLWIKHMILILSLENVLQQSFQLSHFIICSLIFFDWLSPGSANFESAIHRIPHKTCYLFKSVLNDGKQIQILAEELGGIIKSWMKGKSGGENSFRKKKDPFLGRGNQVVYKN